MITIIFLIKGHLPLQMNSQFIIKLEQHQKIMNTLLLSSIEAHIAIGSSTFASLLLSLKKTLNFGGPLRMLAPQNKEALCSTPPQEFNSPQVHCPIGGGSPSSRPSSSLTCWCRTYQAKVWSGFLTSAPCIEARVELSNLHRVQAGVVPLDLCASGIFFFILCLPLWWISSDVSQVF